MIAARLLQLRDRERALGMYSDVIAMVLSLEELRKLEGVSLAYVASVSVSFFARPRNFRFLESRELGRAQQLESGRRVSGGPLLALVFARPKSEKCGKP